ncbi:MAG TPA: class I SAM-dependent methyltransferase [Myxococcales bacterium]|nr:class I SAM-dependent methyltransferase [Myxococcales bacterium]
MTAAEAHAGFAPVPRCWVCGNDAFNPLSVARFDLHQYQQQDPELWRYSGAKVRLLRCRSCGFGQPEALPAVPRYFERMYDQKWAPDWMETELHATYKDLIFREVLDGLERRVPRELRTLLDVGAHVGRFIHLASGRGWSAEGIELNPETAAFAARATGLTVHRMDAAALAEDHRHRYGAVTLTDVLEHIPEPLAILRTLRRLMEPGGWIAVKVPHGRAQLVKERARSLVKRGYEGAVGTNLVHVNQFGPRSLRLALERAGFSDVSLTTGAPELPPATSLRERPKRMAGNAVRWAVWRASQLLPGGLESPLGLHLQAFAQARGPA